MFGNGIGVRVFMNPVAPQSATLPLYCRMVPRSCFQCTHAISRASQADTGAQTFFISPTLIYLLTYLYTCLPTYLPACVLACLLARPFAYPHACLLAEVFACLPTQLLTHLLTYLFACLPTCPGCSLIVLLGTEHVTFLFSSTGNRDSGGT